jgi:hypothetical protein
VIRKYHEGRKEHEGIFLRTKSFGVGGGFCQRDLGHQLAPEHLKQRHRQIKHTVIWEASAHISSAGAPFKNFMFFMEKTPWLSRVASRHPP